MNTSNSATTSTPSDNKNDFCGLINTSYLDAIKDHRAFFSGGIVVDRNFETLRHTLAVLDDALRTLHVDVGVKKEEEEDDEDDKATPALDELHETVTGGDLVTEAKDLADYINKVQALNLLHKPMSAHSTAKLLSATFKVMNASVEEKINEALESFEANSARLGELDETVAALKAEVISKDRTINHLKDVIDNNYSKLLYLEARVNALEEDKKKQDTYLECLETAYDQQIEAIKHKFDSNFRVVANKVDLLSGQVMAVKATGSAHKFLIEDLQTQVQTLQDNRKRARPSVNDQLFENVMLRGDWTEETYTLQDNLREAKRQRVPPAGLPSAVGPSGAAGAPQDPTKPADTMQVDFTCNEKLQ